jgi:c-di-GMP-binding flagellar brake protein YcgR
LFSRKNKSEDSNAFKAPEESRQAFRVSPSPHKPLKVESDDAEATVLNISSGGMAFRSNKFVPGKIYRVRFNLPNDDKPITAKMEILAVGEDKRTRCRFYNLTPEQENQIHRYVLNRQKEDLEG